MTQEQELKRKLTKHFNIELKPKMNEQLIQQQILAVLMNANKT